MECNVHVFNNFIFSYKSGFIVETSLFLKYCSIILLLNGQLPDQGRIHNVNIIPDIFIL